MLVAFRFRNFRSFKGDGELTLIASPSDKSISSALLDPTPTGRSKVRLLPAIAIYGANAAGKTNVLEAISFFSLAIRASQTSWAPREMIQFQTHAGAIDDDTLSMEAEFFLDGVRYVYGFSAAQYFFEDEWLYAYPKGRKRVVFSRTSSEDGEVKISTGDEFTGASTYIESVKSRVRPNSLFLSAAAQDNHPLCLKLFDYFDDVLLGTLIENEESRQTLTSMFADSDAEFKKSIVRFLQLADKSISDIIVEPIGKGWDQLSVEKRAGFFNKQRYKVMFVMGEGDDSFYIPFISQSVGIKKLYGLISEILVSLTSHRIILFDELETSIHPHVARAIVDMFQDSSLNIAGSQLLFTTHDTNLLDQTLLRRDQIWFVEKDSCCSHLYSLLDFSPRNDADLEKGYLRGKYGAIPAVSMPPGWLEITPGVERFLATNA